MELVLNRILYHQTYLSAIMLKTAARETNNSYVLSQIRHQGRGGYGQGGGEEGQI